MHVQTSEQKKDFFANSRVTLVNKLGGWINNGEISDMFTTTGAKKCNVWPEGDAREKALLSLKPNKGLSAVLFLSYEPQLVRIGSLLSNKLFVYQTLKLQLCQNPLLSLSYH